MQRSGEHEGAPGSIPNTTWLPEHYWLFLGGEGRLEGGKKKKSSKWQYIN